MAAIRPLARECAAALLIGFVAAAGFALTSPAHSESVAVRAAQSFDQFWADFRTALLSGSTDAVAAMTRFPLEVHGELDSDPVRHVSRAELAPLLVRVLDADTGTSLRRRLTNRVLIERVQVPVRPISGVAVATTAARVGAFAFERGAAGWRLSRVYMSND